MATLDEMKDAFLKCLPPDTDVHVKINRPNIRQIYVHGVHGSGKTTTIKMAIAQLKGCDYVDENYDKIHELCMAGGDITTAICNMFEKRKLTDCCFIDRGMIDNIAYDFGRSTEKRVNCLDNVEPLTFLRSILEYHDGNHIWLFPNPVETARQRVIDRNREWDDSVELHHYTCLCNAYRTIYQLIN